MLRRRGILYALAGVICTAIVLPTITAGVAEARRQYGWDNWLITSIEWVREAGITNAWWFWLLVGTLLGVFSTLSVLDSARSPEEAAARPSREPPKQDPASDHSPTEPDYRVWMLKNVWTVRESGYLLARCSPTQPGINHHAEDMVGLVLDAVMHGQILSASPEDDFLGTDERTRIHPDLVVQWAVQAGLKPDHLITAARNAVADLGQAK